MTWRRWLNSLTRTKTGRRASSRSVSPFRPGVEFLETREVPAGNVTASLIGTTLTITGDGSDNIVAISNDGLNYNVAGTGTTINGGASAAFSAGSINTIKITEGGGNNSFSIDTARGIAISYTGGAGNDIVSLSNSTFTAFTFIGNGGNDNLTMSGVNGTTLTYTGNDGDDAMTLDLATIRTVTFNGNAGNDTMNATNSIFNSPVGKLTFNGGTEDDTLNLGHVSARTLAFNGNAGNDTLQIGSLFGDNAFTTVTVVGDVGINTVRIHNGFTRVIGQLRITNGAGDSITNLGEQATDKITLGSLIVTNSTGNDFLTSTGAALTIGGAVAINNGAGGSSTAFNSTAVNIGGLTAITNSTGDDVVQFGTLNAGTINVHGVTINNGAGASSTTFGALHNTLTGSLSVTNTDGDDTFQVSGDTFTVIGTVRINNGNGINNTQFGAAATVQVTGAVSITSAAGTDQTSFGVAGTTNVMLGALTINNGTVGGLTSFDGRSAAINGALNLTTSDLTVNGEVFSVSASATIKGSASVDFKASAETTIRGILSVTGGNLIFDSGNNQIKSVNFNGNDLTVNSWTTIATTLTAKSALGSIDNNSTLDVLGSLTITGIADMTLDGTSTFIGGNFTVTTGAGVNVITVNKLSVNGTTNVNTSTGDGAAAAGADQVAVNDSDFGGNVILKTGAGDDVLNVETLNSGAITAFHGTLAVDLGDGDDTGIIGLPSDPNDFISTDDKVTLAGGNGFDALQMLTANNLFFIFPTINPDLENLS